MGSVDYINRGCVTQKYFIHFPLFLANHFQKYKKKDSKKKGIREKKKETNFPRQVLKLFKSLK